jgi:Uma2 family endonuclease
MPELKHAELIDGVVFFMASPVGRPHGIHLSRIIGWLTAYCDENQSCETACDSTWLLGPGDIPQPDGALRILTEFGGQSNDAGTLYQGPPELVVELTDSSISRDLGTKLDLYRRSGVREYLTILLQPKQIIWRQLTRGRYREMHPGIDGFYRSQVFPGLWLDPAAVWDRTKSLRSALDLGLQSPEYAAFVKKLAAKRRS